MRKLIITLVLALAFVFSCAEEDPNDFNLKKLGDDVPAFSFTTLDGETASIKDCEGKTILINFFAKWCGPCMKELPELQSQIWEKLKDKELVVLTFGRGHSAEELKKWNQKKGFTFPISPDEDKSIYELFFTKYIPRNIVISKEGKIILQEFGYSEKGFKHMIEVIKKDLGN